LYGRGEIICTAGCATLREIFEVYWMVTKL
jgi:hypothetical protein